MTDDVIPTTPTGDDDHLADDVMSRVVDDDLGDAERADVEMHLDRCEECRERVERMRAIGALVVGTPGTPRASGALETTDHTAVDQEDQELSDRAVAFAMAAFDQQTAATRQVHRGGTRRRGLFVSVSAAVLVAVAGLCFGAVELSHGGASASKAAANTPEHRALGASTSRGADGADGADGAGGVPPGGRSSGSATATVPHVGAVVDNPTTTLQLRPIEHSVSCGAHTGGGARPHQAVVERLDAPVGSGCVLAGPAAVVVHRAAIAWIAWAPLAGTAVIQLHRAPSSVPSGRFLIVLGGPRRSLAIALGSIHGDSIGTGHLSKPAEATLGEFARH